MWKPSSSMQVIDVDLNCFMVRFGEEKDYFRALTGGPWLILDHYLVVQQWDPSFRVSDKLPSKMVVWIRFPHLPIQLYHKQILSSLGNLIGRTVRMDHNTQTAERGKFARIAVEIDLNEPLVTGVELDGAWQRVEYENLPELCFSCGKVGHEKGSCPSLLQLVPLPTGPAGAAYVQEPPPKPPSGEMADDGYGPWLTVTRNSRRGKRENIPKKETPQKGKEEESNARSKADGISGKHTFGKSKTSGEGPAPSKSSNEKGKESTHSAFIADKGNSSGSAKGIGKPNSKIIGPEKNSGPSAQASHSPKPPSFGKGPAGPSSSASGPPGPKAPLNSEKLSSPHLGPVAAQPKTLVLPFASFQPTPRSHPPLSSTPARQHFLNNSSSPTTKSLPPIPKSKKTTKKKRVFTKKAKDLIIDQVRMSEKEKADLLAAEKGGGEPIAPATAPIKQNESAEIAEMMIVSPSYEAGMPGQDQVRQPKKEMAVLVAAVTEDGDNPAPVSFSTKPSDSDDMVIEQPSTEAGKPGWDLNNPSSENP
ncbi:hypothetical protein LINPERHAP2_LOCUS13202 [Linum perenne]